MAAARAAASFVALRKEVWCTLIRRRAGRAAVASFAPAPTCDYEDDDDCPGTATASLAATIVRPSVGTAHVPPSSKTQGRGRRRKRKEWATNAMGVGGQHEDDLQDSIKIAAAG